MKVQELKKGAIFSYCLIILNTIYGLVFTPFLITMLGDGEYGVYKIIASLTSSITVLDLGIGGTMLRYVSHFNAKDDKKNLSNFCAMGFIQAGVISAVMVVVCIVMYFFIDNLYSNSLTMTELIRAKELFLLFIVILVLNNFEKVIFNTIAGCEHYAFANSLKLVSILLKIILTLVFILIVPNSAMLLIAQIISIVFTIVIQLLYIKYKIKLKIRFEYWDKQLFNQSFKYTILVFIQAIATQMNGNLDNMVIGSVIGSVAVAVYSIGLQLYAMYEQFAVAFSDLMLPTVSRQIAEGATETELENTVIKVGRLEFMALGGALCAYALIGNEFIRLWIGDGYSFAWLVGLLLMIPTTIPLIQNVSLSILRAKNKMLFRTIVICATALFNLIITIVGVKKIGPVAACIGTMLGLIFGNIVAMNIYYVKVIHLNIFRIFKSVFKRTWICCIVASLVLILCNKVLYGSWFAWLAKAVIFCIVYGITLLLYGMNDSEKKIILKK